MTGYERGLKDALETVRSEKAKWNEPSNIAYTVCENIAESLRELESNHIANAGKMVGGSGDKTRSIAERAYVLGHDAAKDHIGDREFGKELCALVYEENKARSSYTPTTFWPTAMKCHATESNGVFSTDGLGKMVYSCRTCGAQGDGMNAIECRYKAPVPESEAHQVVGLMASPPEGMEFPARAATTEPKEYPDRKDLRIEHLERELDKTREYLAAADQAIRELTTPVSANAAISEPCQRLGCRFDVAQSMLDRAKERGELSAAERERENLCSMAYEALRSVDVPRKPPQRWNVYVGGREGDEYLESDMDKDGEWVKWEDIKHRLFDEVTLEVGTQYKVDTTSNSTRP